MLRTFAVALISATVLAAPALAQGSDTKTGTPPAATGSANPATPKVVTAKPALAAVKHRAHRHYAVTYKAHRHYAVRHVHHLAHVAHIRHVTSVKTASYGVKHHVRHVARKPVVATHSAAVTTAKPKSGTN